MKVNFNTSHYRNGDPIPKVTDATAWKILTTGAYCYYNNDSATYAAIFGKLYIWYAVNDPRGLAPLGWHVPKDAEWTTLENSLGGAAVAGGAMKEIGTTHWIDPNTLATNSSGFTGLPGGYRGYEADFVVVGITGTWWSSTEFSATNALPRYLSYGYGHINGNNFPKQWGFSVRCVRD